MRKCCIEGCFNTKRHHNILDIQKRLLYKNPNRVNVRRKVETKEGVSFHQFPLKNALLLEKWLTNINKRNRNDPDFKVNKHMAVCSEHFLPSDFVKKGKKRPRLHSFLAVPTVFKWTQKSEQWINKSDDNKRSCQQSKSREEKGLDINSSPRITILEGARPSNKTKLLQKLPILEGVRPSTKTKLSQKLKILEGEENNTIKTEPDSDLKCFFQQSACEATDTDTDSASEGEIEESYSCAVADVIRIDHEYGQFAEKAKNLNKITTEQHPHTKEFADHFNPFETQQDGEIIQPKSIEFFCDKLMVASKDEASVYPTFKGPFKVSCLLDPVQWQLLAGGPMKQATDPSPNQNNKTDDFAPKSVFKQKEKKTIYSCGSDQYQTNQIDVEYNPQSKTTNVKSHSSQHQTEPSSSSQRQTEPLHSSQHLPEPSYSSQRQTEPVKIQAGANDQSHKHVLVVTSDRNCFLCNKTFREQSMCEDHMLLHLQFDRLGKVFKFQSLVCAVMREETPSGNNDLYDECLSSSVGHMHAELAKPANCFVCGEQYSTKISISFHILKHHLDISYPASFSTTEIGVSELTGFTDWGNKLIGNNEMEQVVYSQSLCEEVLLETHNINLYWFNRECIKCSSKFLTSQQLQTHITLKHQDIDLIRMSRHKKLQVKRIKNMLNRNQMRKNDRKYDREIDKVPCPVCGKLFLETGRGNLLKYHLDLHNDKDSFQCKICKVSFDFPENLNSHNRKQHDPERKALLLQKKHKLVCDLCGIGFHRPNKLMYHIAEKHTGEKLRNCHICQIKFCTLWQLQKHRTTMHPKVRSLSCKVCGDRFETFVYLKSHHIRKHQGIDPQFDINQEMIIPNDTIN